MIIIILNNNHLISIASILCDNVKLLQKREKVYGKEIFLHLLFLSLFLFRTSVHAYCR